MMDQLAQVVQQTGEGIVLVNLEGHIEYANPAFRHKTGYTLCELQALGGWRYLGLGDESRCPADVRKTLEDGRVWSGRHRFACKDGSSFECLSSIAPLTDAEGRISHYAGVHRDITELVRLEKRLVLARCTEAIGALAGGVARDFSDILAEIMGHTYMALRGSGGNAEVTTHLHAIEKQSYRAADLTRQLFAFARKGKLELVPINLNAYLEEIGQRLAARMPSWIDLSVQVPAEPLVVRGDAGLLQQAFMNLLGNVQDSTGVGDPLRIWMTLEELHRTSDVLAGKFPAEEMPDCERYACIRVRHNGGGMDHAVMERLFEPRVSSKASNGSLDLDMAMVKGCVEMHMGHISVDSDPGKATEFTIILPCSDHVRLPRGEQAALPARGEMILLLDGKHERRQAVKDMLFGLGFAVLATDDIREAEGICSKVSHVIDLAVVDLDTPGLGEDAAVDIRSRAPDLPVLFTTSHDGYLLPEHWTNDGAAMQVYEPKRPGDLVYAIRRLIKRGGDVRVEPDASPMDGPSS